MFWKTSSLFTFFSWFYFPAFYWLSCSDFNLVLSLAFSLASMYFILLLVTLHSTSFKQNPISLCLDGLSFSLASRVKYILQFNQLCLKCSISFFFLSITCWLQTTDFSLLHVPDRFLWKKVCWIRPKYLPLRQLQKLKLLPACPIEPISCLRGSVGTNSSLHAISSVNCSPACFLTLCRPWVYYGKLVFQ